MLDVTVIIGTYGDPFRWRPLAERAGASAASLGVPVEHVHAHTLAGARNAGAAMAETEWLCFLDADDELEPGYFDLDGTTADLFVPQVRYVYEDGDEVDHLFPSVAGHHHECEPYCLTEGNWIIVGAPVRRAVFERAGGFRELPVYEDYDLWVRCWRSGAWIERAPGSVYRAHVNPAGRNHGLTAAERRAVQDAIVA